jgi:hypothetical protein
VVDERTRISARDGRHAFQRVDEDSAGVLASDVPAREHECSDFRRLQGEPFELAIADALVARETIQRFSPALASQTSSLVPLSKCSLERSIFAPASRSAVATVRLSSDSSRK